MPKRSRQERFLPLLEEHKKILYKVASSYCRNDADRQDLIQEIAVQLWRSFDRYDERYRFSTWMYRIALNVAISLCVWLGSFNGDHFTEVRFLVPGMVLHLYVIGSLILGVHQWLALKRIDYGAPVVAIQKRLGELRVQRVRATKLILLSVLFLWTPLLIVGAWAPQSAAAEATSSRIAWASPVSSYPAPFARGPLLAGLQLGQRRRPRSLEKGFEVIQPVQGKGEIEQVLERHFANFSTPRTSSASRSNRERLHGWRLSTSITIYILVTSTSSTTTGRRNAGPDR
jgi:Sigma-70 region 2